MKIEIVRQEKHSDGSVLWKARYTFDDDEVIEAATVVISPHPPPPGRVDHYPEAREALIAGDVGKAVRLAAEKAGRELNVTRHHMRPVAVPPPDPWTHTT